MKGKSSKSTKISSIKRQKKSSTPKTKDSVLKKKYANTAPRQCEHCEHFFSRISTHHCIWWEVEQEKMKKRLENIDKTLTIYNYVKNLEGEYKLLWHQYEDIRLENIDLTARNKQLMEEYNVLFEGINAGFKHMNFDIKKAFVRANEIEEDENICKFLKLGKKLRNPVLFKPLASVKENKGVIQPALCNLMEEHFTYHIPVTVKKMSDYLNSEFDKWIQDIKNKKNI